MKPKIDPKTLALMAATVASGMVDHHTVEQRDADDVAEDAMKVVRAIVKAVFRE